MYRSLDLTPTEKANLDQTLLEKGIFDTHGNQLKTATIDQLSWDYQNRLQSTTEEQTDGITIREYNVYAVPGKRSRKLTEKTDTEGNIIAINEAIYLDNLEFRTTWKGENLSYDGESVEDNGSPIDPYEQYGALRIRPRHKQAARKLTYTFVDGKEASGTYTQYSLDNNIDSCEMTLGNNGQLAGYSAYRPYGETCVSYGKTRVQHYKYSGQEEDRSGLYYYGFRSYLPANFRWVNPDPAGMQGSGMNLYAMVW